MKSLQLVILIFLLFGTLQSSCKKVDSLQEVLLEINKLDLLVNLPSYENSRSIGVNTTATNWTASSNQGWCAVSVNNGLQKTIDITVSKNGSLDLRTAAITVKAGNLAQTITVNQLGVNPTILLKSKNVAIDFKSQTFTVDLTTNIELDIICLAAWVKRHPDKKSAQTDLVDFSYQFDVDPLSGQQMDRSAKIYFRQIGGKLTDSVEVKQSVTTAEMYNPGLASAFEKDKKLKIMLATLTPSDKFQSGEDVSKSIDGQLSTLYHSPWSGMADKQPITIEYKLDPQDAEIANYVVLYPRISGNNGIIKQVSVWIYTAEDPKYVQVGSATASMSNNPVVVRFQSPIVHPRGIKIEITDAYSGDAGKYYVSLAEFECYESKAMNMASGDLGYFTDMTFSALRPGTTIGQISQIQNPFIQNIAAFLFAGKYPAEFRIQEYKPFRNVTDLARELKTSTYSQFENMTGIFFSKDEEVVVFVGQTGGQALSLRVTDFGTSGNDYIYPLADGINLLTMKGKGNGYINYYTPDYKTAGKIKIHIASGKVNGYFDANRHTEEDGKKMLDNAVSEILDICGNRVQLSYSVASLKNNCYGRIGELIKEYDNIITIEQTMMGLAKYNRLPSNHMYGRIVWSGYMFADGIGAGFNDNTMATVANPTSVRTNGWGIAHEFGHVNQVRPGMDWVGTTECTNNIYSAWIQYCYTPDKLRLESENVGGTIGGRFNAYLNSGLVNGEEWGLQGGPDKAYGIGTNGNWGGDHFVKLAPLWQLQLYYHLAGEGNSWYKPFFWNEIFEKVRNTNETGLSNGQLQISFVKNSCDAVQQNLSDFFIKIGMLKIVDKIFDDYTPARKTITQEMIDEVVTYAGKYPKPNTDCIYYISGNSVNAFKNKLKVSGLFNSGITGTTSKQISHTVWSNVTVFETYAGAHLQSITMVGTGSSNNTFTNVPYPTDATRIEAVGFDGTRMLVFGTR